MAQRTSDVTHIGGGSVARRDRGGDTLADVLERVLDKGVVIVGDIGVSILDIELLTLKIRLLIASAETAREMGIDWWTDDPFYNSTARANAANAVDDGSAESTERDDETRALRERIAELERRVGE